MSQTLGETLASARRSLGRTLADAENATRVRGKMLDALERGDYDTLPASAYVRGYIISYAKYLELDPAPLLQMFADETGHLTTRETMRLPEQVVATREQNFIVPGRVALLIVAAIVVIALVVWGIGRLVGGPDEPTPLPTVPTETSALEPSAESTTPAVMTTDTPAPGDTTTSAAAGQPFVLAVEISSDGASWLRVTVDGLKAYEGILTAGESKEWDVTDEATVRIGQPSAVTVTRDGVTVPTPTNAETPEMTISASDIPSVDAP